MLHFNDELQKSSLTTTENHSHYFNIAALENILKWAENSKIFPYKRKKCTYFYINHLLTAHTDVPFCSLKI